MGDRKLQDLGQLVEATRAKLRDNFKYDDVELGSGFRKAFADNIASSGNSVEFKKTTAIITTSAGLKIYAPNQWFLLAAYAVDLVREIIKYRNYTEQVLEGNADLFLKGDGSPMEKKEIYKSLKAGDDEDLTEKFINAVRVLLQNEDEAGRDVERDTQLIYKFVSDDKWWLGGKGIERTNDFYVSPVLGVLNLVNASQSYVATITYLYVNDSKLSAELASIAAERYVEPAYCTDFETASERNRIVFGAPGTGKSYKLKQEAEELVKSADSHMERVTFHSDYSYSQFVGAYKPVTDAAGNISYDFVPGPFMRMYVKAIRNCQQLTKVYELIRQAERMHLFPTNPNPPDQEEKWDLFEEITETGQKETFKASGNAKVGDMALIYVAKTKPGYENGIYAIGTIVAKQSGNVAVIRFDYVSYYHPIIDYETLKQYNANIRSYGQVSDGIVELVKEAVIPSNPYLLLIEEINRAKVAAVFGDVFQLLDRDEDGVSEYHIQTSEDIRKYLAAQLGGRPEDWSGIKLPNNLFIWATMNSADQGVFPVDTAFKRRWSFEYLGINAGEADMQNGTIVLGVGEHQMTVDWNQLRKAINEKLAGNDFKVNEDKLMGPFFLSGKVTEPDENGEIADPDGFKKAFKSKVIMYLYEDAAKQHRRKLFAGCDNSGYSAVCEAFDKIGIDIFGEDFRELYDQQKG